MQTSFKRIIISTLIMVFNFRDYNINFLSTMISHNEIKLVKKNLNFNVFLKAQLILTENIHCINLFKT